MADGQMRGGMQAPRPGMGGGMRQFPGMGGGQVRSQPYGPMGGGMRNSMDTYRGPTSGGVRPNTGLGNANPQAELAAREQARALNAEQDAARIAAGAAQSGTQPGLTSALPLQSILSGSNVPPPPSPEQIAAQAAAAQAQAARGPAIRPV